MKLSEIANVPYLKFWNRVINLPELKGKTIEQLELALEKDKSPELDKIEAGIMKALGSGRLVDLKLTNARTHDDYIELEFDVEYPDLDGDSPHDLKVDLRF